MLVANLYRDNFTRNANPDYIFSVIDANIPASTHLVLNADDDLLPPGAAGDQSHILFHRPS